MRGKITGFELLVRKEAPHLLNTNGGTCHRIHNTSKNFLSTFNKHIEQLLTDLRTDMEWSTDLREYLKEICSLLSMPYSMLAARVNHRWSSSYDPSVDDEPVLPALTILRLAIQRRQNSIQGYCSRAKRGIYSN